MHIALSTPTFHPQRGGAETYTLHLTEALRALGHTVDVVSGAVGGTPQVDEVRGVRIARVGKPRENGLWASARWFPEFGRAVNRSLGELRPDVVVGQYSALGPAARYARRAHVPLVALVHDVYGLRENIRWRGAAEGINRYLTNDRLLSRARPNSVIAVSRSTAAAVGRLTDAPVTVALPGTDHVPDGPEPFTEARRVLFVGRLVRSKGVGDAVSAIRGVRDEGLDVDLIVLGKGPEERRLQPWVKRIHGVGDAALDKLVRSSSILLLPSQREGWGLVLTEAVARGLPYVAYDVPAIREQHDIIGGGLLVKAGDKRALSDAVRRLLNEEDLRRGLGRAGRDAARTKLTWAATAFAAEQAINAAMTRHHRRQPSRRNH